MRNAFIAAIVVGLAVVLPWASLPRQVDATGPYNSNIIGTVYAQTITQNGTTTFGPFPAIAPTSGNYAPYGPLKSSQYISIMYQVTTASPNVRIEVLTSIDDANWVLPDSTGGVKGIINSGLTDVGWHHALVAIPLSSSIKIAVADLANNGPTFNATISAQ